jgi:UDP-N-acetylglucosamine:LPS N-acetylglucosamine transferase
VGSITFIFAGGGTGGHLYPGLAIAAELRRLAPGTVRTLFVSSERPLDAEVLGGAGVEFVPSPALPLRMRPLHAAKFLRAFRAATAQSRGLIRERREGAGDPGPVMLVAMGGFVAAPSVRAAVQERAPVALVNLDAVPGKANRWIARHALHVFSSTRVRPGTGMPESAVVVPPIVRAQAAGRGTKAECRRRLGLDPAAPTLMVTGGSQGARSVNEFVSAFVESDAGLHILRDDPIEAGGRPWQVLHQTGKGEDAAAAEVYRRAGLKAVVRPFAEAMGDWWGAADLAIARAGAGNVGEVWANKVPTLFMPYPYHRDEHQRYNALSLEDSGGVRIVRDVIDPRRNLESAGPTLRSLLEGAELRRQMWAALEKLGPADGAARIARELLESITPAAGYAR